MGVCSNFGLAQKWVCCWLKFGWLKNGSAQIWLARIWVHSNLGWLKNEFSQIWPIKFGLLKNHHRILSPQNLWWHKIKWANLEIWVRFGCLYAWRPRDVEVKNLQTHRPLKPETLLLFWKIRIVFHQKQNH